MLEIGQARQLIELTNIGWKMLTKEEYLQIIAIYEKAGERALVELEKRG